MASATSIHHPHITCLDLNGDEKTSNRTDLKSFEHRQESAVKHLHKTVVTLNNNTSYSPVRQSASVTSLSSIAKPLNKGVSFSKFCVQIYSDGDEQQTMTPCLVVNPDPIANSTDEKESLSNPSTLNSSRTDSLLQKNGIKDLNYEAGIVSRLRERFSQIVSGEARGFEAISRARRKRFSSVDDVLATCQASNNNNTHYKPAPMSSYSKTQNFWQSVPNSLQTSSSSDSISRSTTQAKSRFEKASIYSNNQRPEARPRNGLMSQKPGTNTFTQPNPSAHSSRGTEEAVYVIVRPMCDSQNVPAEPVSSPVYSPPHNLQTSASTNFDHLNSTFNRSQERLGGSGYEHSHPAANKQDYKSSEDENTMQSISKLRERFERCSRVAQKTDSLSRPMPRSRSAHVYPSAKILENIQKFENGSKNFEKRPQNISVSARKDVRNIQSNSPPADPQPIAFKQIPLLSNKLVEKHVKDSIDEIDPPSPRLVISSDASPPEEPRPKLLEEAVAKPEHQLTIGAFNSNNVTTCDVDIRLEKSVEIKGHPLVPAVSLVIKDRASEVNQSGKLEMQNLLSKFNQKRGAREAFKSNNLIKFDDATATIQLLNRSIEVPNKPNNSASVLRQSEIVARTSEYPENLMRPNLSELSEPPAIIYAEASTAEKITGSDPIYAIPGPALDTLPEAKSSESESTICPDSSIAETCSSSASSSISPNENSSTSSNAQPRKSLSARYFEEKQRSSSMTSSTSSKEDSSKAGSEPDEGVKELAIPVAKVEPIMETQEEEKEEILSQTSIGETASTTQSTELCEPEQKILEYDAEKAEFSEENENLQLETPVSTDIEPTQSTKEVENAEILEEEIKCLPDVSIENDSTDDGTDSNEDFLTDDFEYSTSLKASLAEDDDGFDVLDHSWKRCLLPEYSMLASDGNPVRHSLLNLADPEDIPELLAAMAEEHHFVFEDYSTEMASTCGIIQMSDKRKPKQFGGRITFVEDPPQVFAYLDESSAREEGEWKIGCAITFEDYQKMSQSLQDEAAQQQMELARWRQTMQNKCSNYQDDSLTKPIQQLIIGQNTSVLKNKNKIAS